MKLQAVLLLAAVVLLGSSHASVLTPKSDSPVDPNNVNSDISVVKPVNDLSNDDYDDDDNAIIPLVDNDGNEENNDDNSDLPDLDLEELRDEDLEDYANAKDLEMEGELDLFAAARMMAARRETTRPKRQSPLLNIARYMWTAGRALLRSSVRGKVSTRGSVKTLQYSSSGNYNDAVRHFWSLLPQDAKNIRNGITGKLWKHTLTVRSTSSSGQPTLEIRSPISPKQGRFDTFVRKFRFGN